MHEAVIWDEDRFAYDVFDGICMVCQSGPCYKALYHNTISFMKKGINVHFLNSIKNENEISKHNDKMFLKKHLN